MHSPQQGTGQGDAAGGFLPGAAGKMALHFLPPVIAVNAGQLPEMQTGFLKTGIFRAQEREKGMPQAIAGIANVRIAGILPPGDAAMMQQVFQDTAFRTQQGAQQVAFRIFGPHAAQGRPAGAAEETASSQALLSCIFRRSRQKRSTSRHRRASREGSVRSSGTGIMPQGIVT